MFLIRGLVKIIIFGLIICIGIMWLSEQGSPNPRTSITISDTVTPTVTPMVTVMLNFQSPNGEPTVATQAYFTKASNGQLYELPQCIGVNTCVHQEAKTEYATFKMVIDGCATSFAVNNQLVTDNTITLTIIPNCK